LADASYLRRKALIACALSVILLPIGTSVLKSLHSTHSVYLAVLALLLSDAIYVARFALLPQMISLYVRSRPAYLLVESFVLSSALSVKALSYSLFERPGLSYLGPDYFLTILLPALWTEREVRALEGRHRASREKGRLSPYS